MRSYTQRVLQAWEREERLAVATVIRAPEGAIRPGTRMYIDENGVEGTLGHPELDEQVRRDALELLARGQSRSYLYPLPGTAWDPDRVEKNRKAVYRGNPQALQIYIETIAPPPRLLVCGAGHDAIPLVRLGHMVGFRVSVADSRAAYVTRERFPEADACIHAHPDEVPERVAVDSDTYIVIMTHNYLQDLELLKHLWGRPYAYLGLLGPWERTEKLLGELREEGAKVEEHLDRLYGPLGLDLGAQGPEQIALAVMAEILAVRNGRSAGFLRFRKTSIHADASD